MRVIGRVLMTAMPVVLLAGCSWFQPVQPTLPFVSVGTSCAATPDSLACQETRGLNVRAQAGDSAAQTALAARYLRSDNGGQNLDQALLWYREAAKAGNADALYILGYLTETGTGMTADRGKALTYYIAAAEAGSVDAQANLGALYETGEAGTRDLTQAANWYRRAADQGSAPARVNLARLLLDGSIPAEGPGAAEVLLRAAVAQGNPAAARLLAKQVEATDSTEARRLYQTAADAGDRQATVALAEMMMAGQGGPRDLTAAKALLDPLATDADAAAQFALGRLYRDAPEPPLQTASTDASVAFADPAETPRWERRSDGVWVLKPVAALAAVPDGIYRDPARATQLIEAAARQGLTPAALATGALYYDGFGVPQDLEAAAAWYRIAAEQGSTVAQANLGVLYANGRGVPLDYKKAALWFLPAAEAGDATAQMNLGILYLNGQGVTVDHQRGAMWIYEAAKQGHILAQKNLSVLYDRGMGVPQDVTKARYWRAMADGTSGRRADNGAPAAPERPLPLID